MPLRRPGFVPALCGVVGLAGVLTYTQNGRRGQSVASFAIEEARDEDALTNAALAVSNAEYGAVRASALYPFEFIAEAHRETTLGLVDSASRALEWSIEYATSPTGSAPGSRALLGSAKSARHGYVTHTNASHVRCVLTTAGARYVVAVTLLNTAPEEEEEESVSSHVLGASRSWSVYCKYVRRELRSLTSGDRARYFRATKLVHTLGLEEGAALYGSAFSNYEAMVVKHLDRRTLSGCTPYHGADVFLTAHAAFTREFERAVASIEPAMGGSPYWDYSLDDALHGEDWAKRSVVFGPDFYGAFDAANEADVTADFARSAFGTGRLPLAQQGAMGVFDWPEANAWGRLTEAWNADSSRGVRRGNAICGLETKARLPGCEALRGAVAQQTTTALRAELEFNFHAELHTVVGGAWGCAGPGGDSLDMGAFATAHPSTAAALENVALNLNLFWRGLFNDTKLNPAYEIRCARPGECVDGATRDADCGCTCETLDAALANARGDAAATYAACYAALDATMFFQLAAYGSEGTRISDYLSAADSQRWRWLDRDGVELDDATDEALTALVAKLVFHPARASAFAGPLSAVNDPLFWPSHANAERVWTFKRLSGAFNETWDYANAEQASHAIPSGCWGYARDARLPFHTLFGEDADDGENVSDSESSNFQLQRDRLRIFLSDALGPPGDAGGYTNAELHEKLSPHNPNLPFVYEAFDWDHCGISETSKTK